MSDATKKDWRVGLCFHTFHPDHTLNHQGCVVAKTAAGAFEVQYLSWLTSEPLSREVVPESYFAGAAFYADDVGMRRASAKALGHEFVDEPSPEPDKKQRRKRAKPDPRAVSARLRFKIFQRDEFGCRYGGRTPPQVQLEIDHIVPLAQGGQDEESNLTTSCKACNRGKGAT